MAKSIYSGIVTRYLLRNLRNKKSNSNKNELNWLENELRMFVWTLLYYSHSQHVEIQNFVIHCLFRPMANGTSFWPCFQINEGFSLNTRLIISLNIITSIKSGISKKMNFLNSWWRKMNTASDGVTWGNPFLLNLIASFLERPNNAEKGG